MSVKIEVSDEVINADAITLCNPLAVKKAVVIPENPTNGDVIKALFPDYKTEIEYERVIFLKTTRVGLLVIQSGGTHRIRQKGAGADERRGRMRLINADELRKQWIFGKAEKEAIDHAPTVDAIPRSEIEAALEEMEALEETEFHMPNTDYEAYAVAYHCVEILKKHMEAPQPKTGHWIGDKAYPICPKCNCNIIEEYISCSDYAEMYKPMKYCPNCGIKMVEPQESEGV